MSIRIRGIVALSLVEDVGAIGLLKELFEKERYALTHFLDNLNLADVYKVLKCLYECKGLIILTGVGKSGFVAEKIASSMTSTGTKALFISPTNALHGDLGIIHRDDVFVIFSKSGESEELLSLIPYVRNKGAKVVAIVSLANSRLSKAADLSLVLPAEQELCPFDLAPTISTTMQLIVGDVLAIALMRMKNVTIEDYAKSHPAGRIGKRISLKVKDLMLTDDKIPLCKLNDKLVDTLVELSNKQCGCVMIVDPRNYLMGIFTDGDLRRSLQKQGVKALESTMESLMIKTARTIHPDALVLQAMELMESDQKKPIMVLPVLEESGKVAGIIKMHDIIQSGIGH